MTFRSRTTGLICAGLSLLGCGEETPPAQPGRFDRPNAVAFACVQDEQVVQLARCDDDVAGNDVSMYALVAQSARGELAAVNLEAARVVDNRRDIPGYSFVPVGEMPIGVVVPPRHPELTYVADYGSRDIRVLDTNALVAPVSMDPTVEIVRVALDATGTAVVLEPGEAVTEESGMRVLAPTDIVLTPDEDALLAAVPDDALVVYLPLQRCTESSEDCSEGRIDAANVRVVPLEVSRDRLRASTTAQAASGSYAKLCGFELDEPEPAELPDVPDDVMMTTPRPIAFAVDADCPEGTDCAPRVLVADDALPVIHALDLDVLEAGGDDASAVLEPLFTGVPTSGVAVTPFVPATVEEDGERQYVYAIDANDGSVLVLEDGQLLSVDANAIGRSDRIPFNTTAAATALAVITPAFDPEAGASQWLEESQCLDARHRIQNPARLRGVFLAAVLTDGTLRIVDVHDMELRACRECPAGDIPVLVRHQPRIDVTFPTGEDAEPIQLAPVATNMGFLIGDQGFPIRGDGSTGSPDAPGLGCIACESDLVQAFPPISRSDEPAPVEDDAGVGEEVMARGCGGRTPALVCAEADPWASEEIWRAVYEGVIPGTTGRIGALIPPGSGDSRTGALEFAPDTELDFCSAGVLGEDDIAAAFEHQTCDAEADAEIEGDQLVILTPPLSAAQLEADAQDEVALRCQEIRDALAAEDAPRLGFEIRRAYRDRLVLRSHLVEAIAEVRSFEEVAPCLERGLLAFDVRTLDQFVVRGSRSGYLHRVQPNAAGRCVVDPAGDPLHQGRARVGCTYRNPVVQFQLRSPEQGELQPLVEFQVQPRSPATKLQLVASATGFLGVTVVGVQLRWNDTDGRLYLVDVHGHGLMPLPLDPLPRFAQPSFN